MRALPAECQLVLVGDPNQLPPVGPGHVLSSLLSLRGAGPLQPSEHGDSASSLLAGGAATAAAAAPAGGHTLAASPLVAAAAAAASLPGRGPAPSPLHTAAAGHRPSPQKHCTRDLLPRVHLGEVFRQDGAGAIVSGALQIIKGKCIVLWSLSLLVPQCPTPAMHLNFCSLLLPLSSRTTTSSQPNSRAP